MGGYSSFHNLKENPFSETPDTRYFFDVASHGVALSGLVSAIADGKGFSLLTGQIGSGKTLLSRVLLNGLREQVNGALVIHPFLGQSEVLSAILEEFQIYIPQDTSQPLLKTQLDRLNTFLLAQAANKKRCVLVIDDAQKLSPEALETVRLLSNLETEREKLLQIILIGQPELKQLLQSNQLKQLEQRISGHFEISGFNLQETELYVQHRIHIAGGTNFIRFQPKALSYLHKVSGGVPRLINRYCSAAISHAQKLNIHLIECSEMRRSIAPMLPPSQPMAQLRGLFGLKEHKAL